MAIRPETEEWPGGLFVRVRTNSLGLYVRIRTNAICSDTFLAGVTRKTYNTSIEYANITHAWVHGGRAYVQERLGLKDEGVVISLKALLRFLNYLYYDYAYSGVILHSIANVSLCIFSQYDARHYQHVSSDIRQSTTRAL